MRLEGANRNPQVSGLDELPGKSNYFIGNEPDKWRTEVPNYEKVAYREVYSGVDLIYYGDQRQLEFDFVIAPGTDPKTIRLAIQGGEKLQIDHHGDLVMKAGGSALRLHRPMIYQDISGTRKSVDGTFAIRGANRIGFEVARYDMSKPLIIDPVLSYSTYLGGNGDDGGDAIAVDSSGNAYVTGSTQNSFPTLNPYQAADGGTYDAFVTKMNSTGTALIYSTYLGGHGQDSGNGIAVDSFGDAFVAGWTFSNNFPTTAGAFQTTLGGTSGGANAFVTELNPAGSALVYSTYLGGSANANAWDWAYGIALDSFGSAYITGFAETSNFPTTPGAFQTTLGATLAGNDNAFVTKLNPTGTALVYSTYLGGSNDDDGTSIAVDSSGNAYVTGTADSANFPITPGAFQTTPSVSGSAFVTKLNPSGTAPVYSTFFGNGAQGNGIAVDSSGDAYVTGSTFANVPTTPGAFQTTIGGNQNAFVTELNPAGTALIYSTYLGGNDSVSGGGNGDTGYGIAVDSSGDAYVTGSTVSTNFPTTADAFQTTSGGYGNAFVAELNPSGSALVYSTYLGGSVNAEGEGFYDQGLGIAVDSSGNVYVTGATGSTNFPTTAGAYQTVYGGGPEDAFVAKFSLEAGVTPTGSNVPVAPAYSGSGTSPAMLTFADVTEAGTTMLTTSATGNTPPTGFQLGTPPTYYYLSTTAQFAGSVTVCVNYTGVSFTDPTKLQLLHYDNGAWVDVTTTLNTVTDTICGSVTSFSPFAVVQSTYTAGIQPPISAGGTSVFAANRGVVPVKFNLALSGVPTCELPPATIALTRTAGGTTGPIDETTFTAASDNGVNFRIDTTNCQYVYNLSTSSLGSGTYQVQIMINNVISGNGQFGLK